MLFVMFYVNKVAGKILEQLMERHTRFEGSFQELRIECGDVRKTWAWNLKVLPGRGITSYDHLKGVLGGTWVAQSVEPQSLDFSSRHDLGSWVQALLSAQSLLEILPLKL